MILETENILIRPMTEEDSDVVFQFNSNPESLKYIVREPFVTLNEGREKTISFTYSMSQKEAIWWVFVLKETNEKIGYGGLFNFSFNDNKAEIGYGLRQEFTGKRYMSEIVPKIIEYGKKELKLRKIYGTIIKGNTPSVKLLENNGFVKEAHFKEHSYARNQYFDEMVYSLFL